MTKKIFITDFDMKRFKWLISNTHRFDKMDIKHLKQLEIELANAEIVEPKDIPADVVTMNSKVRIKFLDTNEEKIFTLVFPFDADLEQDKLSILAPIGVAIIGYKTGETIEWDFPKGKRQIKIEEIIYQPEREGNYYI